MEWSRSRIFRLARTLRQDSLLKAALTLGTAKGSAQMLNPGQPAEGSFSESG